MANKRLNFNALSMDVRVLLFLLSDIDEYYSVMDIKNEIGADLSNGFGYASVYNSLMRFNVAGLVKMKKLKKKLFFKIIPKINEQFN